MQRYFSNCQEGNSLILSSDDMYHIKKVMRMNLHDKIEVVYNQQAFLCEIISFDPMIVGILKKIEEVHNNHNVIIVQSLVNENKMDLILQKGTELGASAFYGYKAYNSVIKENNKSDKKIMRWQKIVKEASEQSKRNTIPTIGGIIDIQELISLEGELKIILSVKEKSNSIKNVLQNANKCDKMIIVIGPEGGFDEKEEQLLVDSGYKRVSLGERVLRTETASIACLSMINYEWMV